MTRVDELRTLAGSVVRILEPACTRIEIVGALRRGAPAPNDIDIVCAPVLTPITNLFGEVSMHSALRIIGQLKKLVATLDLVPVKEGPRMAQYLSRELDASIDIFIVFPPAQYGAIQAIRTGPADFARLCVTPKAQGGAMPFGMKQADGSLWRDGGAVETATEEDWFRELGLPCWPPGRRSAEGLKMYLNRGVVQH